YVRLVTSGDASTPREPHWTGRAHFFAAAAEAMRRILIENARRKQRLCHGGAWQRVELREDLASAEGTPEEVLAVDEALEQLAARDPGTAKLVKLVYFAGLTMEQAAETLGISTRTAYRDWAYARAWLFRRLDPGQPPKA